MQFKTDIGEAMKVNRMVCRAGWLIDGTGRPALKDCHLHVHDGRIQGVTAAHEPLPPDAEIVDLTDCTVFPALVDSHVHLVMSGSTSPEVRRDQLSSGYRERRNMIAAHLRQLLHCGILAVRDGGDHNGDTLRYKTETLEHASVAVTIASPGRARHAKGRYGKLIGIAVGAGEKLVQSAFAANSRRDHLKLVNSGLNSLTQFGVETPPQFTEEALAEAISAAKRRGLPTMVHANGILPVKLAVVAGCDSIEHGFFMGVENMRRMADQGVVWVPTAVTMKAYVDYLSSQGHRSDPSFAEVSRRNLAHQLEQISIANRMGVALAVGTDAGSPGVHHGKAVKEELQLFVAAGLSVEEAIRCASRNGARLMKLADRGELTPGMRADFMAVKGPPGGVPESLDRIEHRVIEGRLLAKAN